MSTATGLEEDDSPALRHAGPVVMKVAPGDDSDQVLRALGRQGPAGVVLVVGGAGTSMTSSVDLKRLARHVREWPRPFTLVSTDRIVRAAARGEGLHAVPSLDGRGHIQRIVEFPIRATGRIARIVLGGRVSERYAGLPARARDIVFGPVLSLALLGAAAGAFLFFIYPSVDMALRLASTRETVRIKAVAEPALNLVDATRGRVPARIVQTEVTGSRRAPATGHRTVPVRRASGEITLINLTAGGIYLPAGTIAATPDGDNYLTVVDVTVPATTGTGEQREEGRLTVAVAAEINGADGNLGSGNIDGIEGPLQFSLDVEQPGAIAGGTDRESTFVTETDRQALRDGLLNDLVARADADLKAGVQPGEIMRVWPLGAQNPTVVEASFDAVVDQEVGEVGLDLRVRFFATVFKEDDLRELVRATLVGDVPGEEPDFELVGDSLVVAQPEIGGVISGAVAVTVEGSGVLRGRIDTGEIRDVLIDRPMGEVDAYLADLDGLAAYDLRFWPAHAERTTRLPFRLSVRIDQTSPFGTAP